MIVKELFGTQIINASFLFANSNISVKSYSKDFPSVGNDSLSDIFNNYQEILNSGFSPQNFIIKKKISEKRKFITKCSRIIAYTKNS